MRAIRTSGLMSGDGKRSVAAWPKPPRPSSTLRWIDVPPTRRADLRQQKGPGARVEVAHEQRDVVQFQCVRHSKSKACCGIGIERGSPLPHKSISEPTFAR